MSDSFDPYRVWLGIPPAEQPPNHYRLLGVGLFESDPDVIESAADRQMAHVQTRKTGKHGSLTQQLLNELAAARLVLLNKEKKAAYDKELKEKSLAAKGQAQTAAAKAIPKAQAISSSAAPAAPPVAGGTSTANSSRAIARPLAVAQAEAAGVGEGAGVADGGFALSSGRGSAAIRSRRRRSNVTPYAILGGVGLGVIVLIAVLNSGSNSGSNSDKAADKGRPTSPNQRPISTVAGGSTQPSNAGHQPQNDKVALTDPVELPNGWVIGPTSRLPSPVNGQGIDQDPCLSADGLVMIFQSDRPGGRGLLDLWMTTRPSTRDSWSKPENLGPTVNSSQQEGSAALSSDGLTLIFGSDRDGQFDLFQCVRRNPQDAWDSPVRIGGMINGPVSDSDPTLSADGLTLVFASDREGGRGSRDLWICTRGATSDSFSSPRNLGPPVNSGGAESSPCLSSDGRHLLFWSDRTGGPAIYGIWVSSRDSQQAPFGPAINVSGVNSVHGEGGPFLSADGKFLLFASSRPDGQGIDIYQSEVRIPNESVEIAAESTASAEPLTADDATDIAIETPATEAPTEAEPPKVAKTFVKFLRSPLAGRLDLKELDSIIDLEAGEFPQSNFLASDEAEKPPSEKDQAEALKLVKEVYETEYAAATTPQDKLALAARLFEKAAEDAGDSAARFALLLQARDLAAEAGNLSCALNAIDALDMLYELDATAQKTQLLKAAAQDMRAGANSKSLAANALKQVDGAIQANDLAGAEELRALGEAAAQKSRDARLTKLAGRIDEELQSIADQFTQFEQAAAIRKESPKDPAACLTMGKFYCFVAGDWQKGLPFFSVVEDEALKAAAAKDQLRPDEPDQQAAVGDAWWSLVETADEADKTAIRERAAHWYNLAVEQLTGLAQEKVRNRLASLEQMPAAVASGGELPKFAKDFIGRYYLRATNKSKDVTQTILEFAENGEVTENNQAVAHWDVDEGTRIRITFPDAGDQPVYFKPRASGGTISATRSSQGETWRWQLTRLFVVSVWKHETEEPRFGRPGRDRDRRRTEETLTFYSNGRVNDPLGAILWTLQGRNLLIDWGDNKRTAAVLNAAGNAYTGKTSQPTGIGSIKIDLNVEGKLIGKE